MGESYAPDEYFYIGFWILVSGNTKGNWEFGLAQEETIKLGQTDTDGTLYDIATITLYNGSYISFEIGGFDMTFEVNEDTADYLNGYFE